MITPQYLGKVVSWMASGIMTVIGGYGQVTRSGTPSSGNTYPYESLCIVVRGEDSSSGFSYVANDVSVVEGWTMDQDILLSNYSGRNMVVSGSDLVVRFSMSFDTTDGFTYGDLVTVQMTKEALKSDFGTDKSSITVRELILAQMVGGSSDDIIPLVVVNDRLSDTFSPMEIYLGDENTAGDTITVSFSIQV